MIKIVLAEDHLLVREGLCGILQKDPDLAIVGEACHGLDALSAVSRARPDILLLDLSLPRMHGLEVLSRLRRQKTTRVIIVSMHSDMPSVVEALRLGARGFALKETPSAELVMGIKAVARGETFICDALEPQVRSLLHERWGQRSLPSEGDSLTARERVVLAKVASGLSSEGTAKALGISSGTVAKHRANLMRKIGAKTQVDVLRYAARSGLMSL